jgi:hypothetical protein
MQRYRYIKDLQIQFPVTLYRYYHGNYLGTLNYIWKVPINPEKRSETAQARVLATIQEKLPQYFTRQMRKNALGKVNFICILLEKYSELNVLIVIYNSNSIH